MEAVKNCIGIDIGGTEIKGAVVDGGGGILLRASCPTRASEGLPGIKKSICEVLDKLFAYDGNITGVGAASAGNINHIKGTVAYATDNLPGYTGFDLAGFIGTRYKVPVFCDNDAYCALKGEICAGAAAGQKNVLMLTLGTGVGGAAAIGGEILHGKNFDAARFGHMILIPGGRKCNCGNFGCAEQYLSGTAFTNGFKALGFDITHGSQVFEIAGRDVRAKGYIEEFFSLLACFAVSIHNAFAPESIIIGGGMVNSSAHWWEFFENAAARPGLRLKKAKLLNDAGIIGAAYTARQLI